MSDINITVTPSNSVSVSAGVGTTSSISAGSLAIHADSHLSGGRDAINHNNLYGLQGGSSSERYHLTKEQYDSLGGDGSFDFVSLTGNQTISGEKTFLYGITTPYISLSSNEEYGNAKFGFSNVSGETIDLVMPDSLVLNDSLFNTVYLPRYSGELLTDYSIIDSGTLTIGALPVSPYDSETAIATTNLYINDALNFKYSMVYSGGSVLSGYNLYDLHEKAYNANAAALNNTNSLNSLESSVVYLTQDQTISGVKTFVDRPFVNGTGVMLSGEAAPLPTTIVYQTGDQNISGVKTFVNNAFFSGNIGIGTSSPSSKISILNNNFTTELGYSSTVSANGITVYGSQPATYGKTFFGCDAFGNSYIKHGNSNIFEASAFYDTAIKGNVSYVRAGNSKVDIGSPYERILMDSYGANAIQFFAGNNERVRINNLGRVGIGTNSPAADVDIARTWNSAATVFTGIKLNITDTASSASSNLLDLQVNGVSQLRVDKAGEIKGPINKGAINLSYAGAFAHATWNGVSVLQWTSTTVNATTTRIRLGEPNYVYLQVEGVDALALRNANTGLNPQTLRLYNTYTDTSNYERGFLRWNTNVLQIGTEKGSVGGTARALELQTDGSTRTTITSSGNVGIGTTTPSNLLHLDCTINKGILLTNSTQAANRANFYINVGNGGAYNCLNISESYDSVLYGHIQAYAKSLYLGGFANAQSTASVTILNDQNKNRLLELRSGDITSSAVFTVLSTGNVGVGTTSPAAKLDISDTTGAASGSLAASALNIAQTWNTTGIPTAIKLNVTDTASNAASLLMDLQVGSVSKFNISKIGKVNATEFWATASFSSGASGGFYNQGFDIELNRDGLKLGVASYLSWYSNKTYNTRDLVLVRDAADTLAQRNSTNAQTFRLYNTYTDASNYERGFIRYASNVFEIGNEAAGTGSTVREVKISTNGAFKAGSPSNSADFFYSYSNIFALPSGVRVAWSNNSTNAGTGHDVNISRSASGILQIGTNATNADGSLLLANLTASGNVSISGHLSAATKSFKIPHQTKSGYLQYGVVESNEHSVYVRGESSENTITLPDHWEWLVDEDSITVQLTSVGKFMPLYIIDKNNKKVTIGGVEGSYNYTIYGTRKDVPDLIVETEE